MQIAKRRMPNGQLANVVRCVEKSAARISQAEVSAQLARLTLSIATGALNLNSLCE